MSEVFFTDLTAVNRAHAALVATLAACAIWPPFAPFADDQLVIDDQEEVLNVLKSLRAPDILAEMMGLGEEYSTIEWTQHFTIEWIVKGDDAAARQTRFNLGMAAIAATLKNDPTLGGNCRGLTIEPPDFAGQTFPGTAYTEAVSIPLRVTLRAPTMIS